METLAAEIPGPLPAAVCEKCNRILDANGECPACRRAVAAQPKPVSAKPIQPAVKPQSARPQVPSVKPIPSRIAPIPAPLPASLPPSLPPSRGPESSEIMELPLKKPSAAAPKRPGSSNPGNPSKPGGQPKPGGIDDPGAEEFWKLPD
jgi:hypothetical protein